MVRVERIFILVRLQSELARLFQRALGQEFGRNVTHWREMKKRESPWLVTPELPFLSQASRLTGPLLLPPLVLYLSSHLQLH